MIIGALKENKKDENRIALTPESAELLAKLGHKCIIEKGAGAGSGFADVEYKAAGVKVLASSSDVIKSSEALIKVYQPTSAEIKKFKAGQILITFIWPAQNSSAFEGTEQEEGDCSFYGHDPKNKQSSKNGCPILYGKYRGIQGCYRVR